MHDDDVSIAAEVHVEFDLTNLHLEGQVKSCQRVPRGIGRRTPMRDDHEIRMAHPLHSSLAHLLLLGPCFKPGNRSRGWPVISTVAYQVFEVSKEG